MIEPIHLLAFSTQANRGVYAVLLGSGLSRSAQIPHLCNKAGRTYNILDNLLGGRKFLRAGSSN